jgi:hypothetical protein
VHKKYLSDTDLGIGSSNQTHIGLHGDMLSHWSSDDKEYSVHLFLDTLDNGIECLATINAITREDGTVHSPKIKVGTAPHEKNLNKLIRQHATTSRRYLTLSELPDGKLIALLSSDEQEEETSDSTQVSFLDKPQMSKDDLKRAFSAYVNVNAKSNSTAPTYISALTVMPPFLRDNGINCPDVWDEEVDQSLLLDAVRFIKPYLRNELDGFFSNYTIKSHWFYGWFKSGIVKYLEFLESLQSDFTESLADEIDIATTDSPYYHEIPNTIEISPLAKPFLLLAGISGTGKTRFVKEQAKQWGGIDDNGQPYNYCLVPVRPDWHEPSDLLGYISRINGTRFIATDFLKFMIKAWDQATESVTKDELNIKNFDNIAPFWLCLDEMNLAPVEQYFADFLSILESREINDKEEWVCQPILKPSILQQLRNSNSKDENTPISADLLWDELFDGIAIDEPRKQGFIEHFEKYGIDLPPNLIVAGTVNMDETTHGFSRKVIDRAITLDFQEFFPNEYNAFLPDDTLKMIQPKTFSFPRFTEAVIRNEQGISLCAGLDSAVAVETRNFLTKVNMILDQTPFQLAYRALNEILLSLVGISSTKAEMAAAWDDFLMQKVLPRIEGDGQKLNALSPSTSNSIIVNSIEYGSGSILHELYHLLEKEFGPIWTNYSEEADSLDTEPALNRVDLLRDTDEKISCRSQKKLLWMMKRLKSNHFTDFWV